MTNPRPIRPWAHFCPRCGAPPFVSEDGRRHACAACHFVYFHNLAAAVAAVIRCGERIAFIVRGKAPGLGLLDLPGGFVDPGESLESAMLREIDEETGWSVGVPRYLFSYPNTYPYGEVVYTTVDAFFEFNVEQEYPVHPNPEVSAVVWQRLDEVALDALAFVSIRTAVQRLRDA